MEVVICHLLSEEAQSSGCQVWWSVLRCWLLMRTDHSGTTKWGPRPRRNFFFLSFFKSPLLPFIVDCCLEAVQINRLYWSWLGWERRSVMDRHCMISSFCRPSDTSCWLSFKQILAPPSCQRTNRQIAFGIMMTFLLLTDTSGPNHQLHLHKGRQLWCGDAPASEWSWDYILRNESLLPYLSRGYLSRKQSITLYALRLWSHFLPVESAQ